jgi:hypothetical protein
VGLRADQEIEDLLAGQPSLSALALGGGKALITDATVHNAAEHRVVAMAMVELAKVLKGESARASVAPTIAEWAASLPASVKHPITKAGAEWVVRGDAEARVRKVGDAWVIVEIPPDGPEGIYVSIYTDKFSAAK